LFLLVNDEANIKVKAIIFNRFATVVSLKIKKNFVVQDLETNINNFKKRLC